MRRVQAWFSQTPSLGDGDVHVWIADLDAGGAAKPAPPDSLDLLSADERERAGRFRNPRDRSRWVCSRVLLRLLLGAYAGVDPAAVRFELETRGKPRLAPEHAGPRFNMSHSGATAVYAVALELELGVDVEALGRGRDVLTVARRAFGREERGLLSDVEEEEKEGDRRECEFLRLWTRHEARLKCLGVGLGGGQRRGQRDCWVSEIAIRGRAVAALAAASPPVAVTCRHWPDRAPGGDLRRARAGAGGR